MANVVDFTDRFPEFCQVNDTRIQMFLDDAALLMGADTRWLEFYEVAHAYHAAHLLTVAEFSAMGDSGGIYPVKESEVDDVIIKNAIGDITPTMDDLYSTTYGKRYISYRRIVFVGIYGV